MEIGIKINNVLVKNVIFTEKGENEIHTTNFKEEFFGVYNVGIGNKTIICESSSPNNVNCDVLVKESLLENLFEKVPFKIIDSTKNKVVINKNLILGKSPIVKTLKQVDAYIEIEEGLKEHSKSKKDLEYLLEKSEKEKITISEEINELKKQIQEIGNDKKIITEESLSPNFQNYKEELLSEFFRISEENENSINEKFEIIENSLKDQINENFTENLEYFKQENREVLKDALNEMYGEISDSINEDKEEFKNILINESSIMEEKYDSKVKEQINLYSEINRELFESVNVAKKETEKVLKEQIEESKKKLLESFESSIQKQKKNVEEYSKINQKLFEGVANTRKEMENTLQEKIEESKQNILNSFEKYKQEFSNSFIPKFDKIINRKKEELKKETESILEQHDNGFLYFTEEKKREIENISSSIITEANKKIKDLEKKVENLSNQLNKSNSEKKRIENLLQESRTYTDRKVNQVLEESKRFTRIMMDMVGGGSGSVAVQYANGGNINGDLNVSGTLNSESIVFSAANIDGNLNIGGDLNVGGSFNSQSLTFSALEIDGDLDVGGILTANTILSGDRNLTDIFAGEGEGDTNILDGGTA